MEGGPHALKSTQKITGRPTHFQLVLLLHIFDPLVGLALGVDQQRPAAGLRYDDAVVNGEGVIGLFPEISREMAEPFVYESCTPIETLDGKMWGEFDFIVQSGP